jgi:hypothetical protein
LLKEGTDPRYGARHLKRAIERNLVFPLANLVATGQVKLGDFVRVDMASEGQDDFRERSREHDGSGAAGTLWGGGREPAEEDRVCSGHDRWSDWQLQLSTRYYMVDLPVWHFFGGGEGPTPVTLHLQGEFVESNLGAAEDPAGSLTVRMIAQQFVFVPQCIVVPAAFPSRFESPAPMPCTS